MIVNQYKKIAIYCLIKMAKYELAWPINWSNKWQMSARIEIDWVFL